MRNAEVAKYTNFADMKDGDIREVFINLED